MRLYRVKDPQDVLRIIKENFSPLGVERINISEAGGRVAGEEITATEDVPGFDRSTVDGYAVCANDTFGAGETLPAMLELLGEICIGELAPPLFPGKCFYIPTGGMLPEGADAVVMAEQTEAAGDTINCYSQVAPGDNVVRRGEDLTQGNVVINKGRKLRAAELGLLASLGIVQLAVMKKPRVGILSTGNELVPYDTKRIPPGKVRDSNALALCEMAGKKQAEILYGGILQDNYLDFRHGVEGMLGQVDFLVLSGGSSVGTRDFTAQVLQELSDGGLLVEGIAISPGKPTLLANCLGKPVLGLPGHPVSALNIFSLFGLVIIDRLVGRNEEQFVPTVRAILSRNIPSRPGRTDYIRVKLEKKDDRVEAIPVFGKSGILRTLAEANGVVMIPAGSEGLLAGTEVEVIIWD